MARRRHKKQYGTSAKPAQSLLTAIGGAPTAAGRSVTDQTAMQVSVVYSCVRVIAEDVAKLPIRIVQSLGDDGFKTLKNHPLASILRRPNRIMNYNTFMLSMASNLAMHGNAIAVILEDDRGVQNGLWPICPSRITLYESSDGILFYQINGAISELEKHYLSRFHGLIPDRSILHIRGLTFDGIIGVSPLQQMRETIATALAGETHSGKMMSNGAQISGVLEHPGKIDPSEIERLRSEWREKYQGSNNTGSVPVLQKGMTFKPMGMTTADAQFLEQRRFSDEQIASAYRVPLHMIGRNGGNVATAATEQQTRQYYDQVLMPTLEAFENALWWSFIDDPDIRPDFDVSRLLRADFKTRQEGRRLQSDSGMLSLNEWRINEGMNPNGACAVFRRALNTAYVDEDGKIFEVTPAGGADPVFVESEEAANGE